MSGIRLGDLPDMSAIVELGLELQEQSIYAGIKPDQLKFRKLVGQMMLSKTGRVWVIVDDNDDPQGFLLGMVTEFFFSKEMYATDVAFYVREGYRNYAMNIVKAFISWAKSKPKVKQIKMAISSGMDTDGRTGMMYELLGFENLGGIYIMRVNQ